MGAATCERLRARGDHVIGIDLHDAEVIADLGTPEGRHSALNEIEERCDGALDGLVTWAGLGGLPDRSGAQLVSVNYFGSIALLEGLQKFLAKGRNATAVSIGSNSTTCQPAVPLDVVQHCLEGDEERARVAADAIGSISAYPASKLALTRWARHHAPTEGWAGAGIALNVLAPGAVETPLLAAARADELLGPLLEAFPMPVGRYGTASELAGVVEFLLSDDARYLCGSVVVVDGGTEALLRADDLPTPFG
jgi:NAD(P)-dependent dehydrogenase (short-subunit alcohol dehydrogenase family)